MVILSSGTLKVFCYVIIIYQLTKFAKNGTLMRAISLDSTKLTESIGMIHTVQVYNHRACCLIAGKLIFVNEKNAPTNFQSWQHVYGWKIMQVSEKKELIYNAFDDYFKLWTLVCNGSLKVKGDWSAFKPITIISIKDIEVTQVVMDLVEPCWTAYLFCHLCSLHSTELLDYKMNENHFPCCKTSRYSQCYYIDVDNKDEIW